MTRRPERTPLGLLVLILQDHVDRPEALCIDQGPLFDKALYVEDAADLDEHLQSRDQAAAFCQRCPHMTSCEDSLTRRRSP